MACRQTWAFAAFAASVLLPSTGQVAKHGGGWAVAAFIVAGTVALWVAVGPVRRVLSSRITPRSAFLLGLVALGLLAAAFALIYPEADAGHFGGGSDRDDALDLAAGRLLDGQLPYAERTYLGNPVSPLPGAVLLAVPFVAVGASALQNLFWMALLFAWMRRHLADGASALLLVVIFALSPAVLAEVLTGGDLPVNSIYVLLAMAWAVRAAGSDRPTSSLIAAACLGIALSSRINFALLLPLVWLAAAHRGGTQRAVTQALATVAAFAAVTLPFYFCDPAAFSPLATASEVGRFATVVPGATWIAGCGSVLLALGVAVRARRHELPGLLRGAAAVQALPVGLIVALSAASSAGLDSKLLSFGLFFQLFGMLGTWPWLSREIRPGGEPPELAAHPYGE